MKKPIIVLVMMVLGSQLPFCPYSLIPSDWISSMEYGKKWTGILLQAYGLVASPAPEMKSGDLPCPDEQIAEGVVTVAVNISMPEMATMMNPAAEKIEMKIDAALNHKLEMALRGVKLRFHEKELAEQ